MKRLIFVLLVMGTILILFSCSQDNLTAPEVNQENVTDQAVQKPATLAMIGRTLFTGKSTPVQGLDPGTTTVLPTGQTLILGQVNEWYDETTDARTTGPSIWVINKLLEEDGTGRVWGTAEIIVDNEACKGKWEMTWWGTVSPEGVLAKAIGTGVEGDVKGLSAKWRYTMVFAQGRFYIINGFMIGCN